jgi:hypothetical protein
MIRRGQKKKTKDLKKALRFIEKFQEHPHKKEGWSVGQLVSLFSHHLHHSPPPKKPTVKDVCHNAKTTIKKQCHSERSEDVLLNEVKNLEYIK